MQAADRTHTGPADGGRADGAALYARYCALCHGVDREGYAADHAPSLRAPELWESASPAWLWYAVAYGRPGTAMAAFAADQGGPLSHDDQHRLLDWLQAQVGVQQQELDPAPISGDVTRGARVYDAHCAECHGAQGEGVTGPMLANPVLLATSSDAFLRHAIARGRQGTPMVAFQDRLPPDDLDAVTAFLRSRAAGWQAPAAVVVAPPDLSRAVLHPDATPARLPARDDRFVPAADVAAALEAGQRMILLDARPLSDWQRGHIPGALPVPFYDGVEAILPRLPADDTPIFVYCACPHAASGKVVDALRAAGRPHAWVIDEGILIWAARGYPLAVGGAAETSSSAGPEGQPPR